MLGTAGEWGGEGGGAGMTAVSAALLVYSALMVPVQLSFWLGGDPCNLYPSVMARLLPLSPFPPPSPSPSESLSPPAPSHSLACSALLTFLRIVSYHRL